MCLDDRWLFLIQRINTIYEYNIPVYIVCLFPWYGPYMIFQRTHRLLKPPKTIKSLKKILWWNYVTQARCIFFNPYNDQNNNMIWSIFKLRLKTRTIFTFSGFQKAFYDEVQIMEHNYFKMTLTRYSKI